MPRESTLPSELLYEIVGLIFGEYLDDVIAGPHRFPGPTPLEIVSVKLLTGTGLQEPIPPPANQNTEDLALSLPNPVIPLLNTSFQLREVTLKVMSDALGIAIHNEGVGRLVLKPWPRIQLIRMTYMNPLEYQPDRDSSPLLTTYHLLALAHIHYSTATLLDARPDLQELMDAVESDQQPEQRLGYGQLQSIFDIVIALPFTIKQGVLKNAVIFRVADMVCRIPAFIQFKDVLSCALTVYDTLKDIDDVIVRATEVGYQIDIMESRYAATVDALHRTLKQYCRADMQRNRLRDKYSVWLMTNTISPNLGIEFLDIAKARGLMQNIVDYSERPGTEYPKCRQVALAILESLVIFDAAAAAAKPREDFAPPVIADSVDSLDIGKLNIG